MADTRTQEQRRRIMQSVKGRNIGPEMAGRRVLHRADYRVVCGTVTGAVSASHPSRNRNSGAVKTRRGTRIKEQIEGCRVLFGSERLALNPSPVSVWQPARYGGGADRYLGLFLLPAPDDKNHTIKNAAPHVHSWLSAPTLSSPSAHALQSTTETEA